jgi:hypothetical protein
MRPDISNKFMFSKEKDNEDDDDEENGDLDNF